MYRHEHLTTPGNLLAWSTAAVAISLAKKESKRSTGLLMLIVPANKLFFANFGCNELQCCVTLEGVLYFIFLRVFIYTLFLYPIKKFKKDLTYITCFFSEEILIQFTSKETIKLSTCNKPRFAFKKVKPKKSEC